MFEIKDFVIYVYFKWVSVYVENWCNKIYGLNECKLKLVCGLNLRFCIKWLIFLFISKFWKFFLIDVWIYICMYLILNLN